MVRQPVAVGGSGSSYIYGFMDSNYKTGMSKDQCLELTASGELLLLQCMLGAGVLLQLSHYLCVCLLLQLWLWPWRGTAPAAASSDWRPFLRRAWSDASSWETSCPSSPPTEHAQYSVHVGCVNKVFSLSLPVSVSLGCSVKTPWIKVLRHRDGFIV